MDIGTSAADPTVTTLAQRKAAEAVRRMQASDAVAAALRAYACREGGAFVVFGSYVAQAMRFDSDLDILIDFPTDGAGAAWRFVEDVCAAHHLPPDIHDARTSRSTFADRVRATGLVLP